jgi:hypothetical protein
MGHNLYKCTYTKVKYVLSEHDMNQLEINPQGLKRSSMGLFMHKNVRLSYIFSLSISCQTSPYTYKKMTCSSSALSKLVEFLDAIEDSDSSTRHRCPWMQIHSYYVDYQCCK